MAEQDVLKVIEETCNMYAKEFTEITDMTKLLILAQTCFGNIAMICRGAMLQKLKEDMYQ